MRFTCMLTVQLPRRGGEGFGKYSVAVLLSCGFSTELYQEVQVCFTVSLPLWSDEDTVYPQQMLQERTNSTFCFYLV